MEKIVGREIVMSLEEVFESQVSLSKIMEKEFGDKSAYRLGKLHQKFVSLLNQFHKDRLPIFEKFGKRDDKGNIVIPKPGEAPVRKEGEAEDIFNRRLAEYDEMVKLNEGFQKEMAELLHKKVTVNVPPIALPEGFTITPADRMELAWLLGDGEEILEGEK